MYLTRPAVIGTLDAIASLGGVGTRLAHDMWHLVDDPGPRGTAARAAPAALSLIGEPVTFGVHPEDYEALLGRHGFRLIEFVLAPDLQARYAPSMTAAAEGSLYVVVAETVDPAS